MIPGLLVLALIAFSWWAGGGVLYRLVDMTDEPSGLPLQTLAAALVPCCALRCRPGSVCATDHHGTERARYNVRIHGTEQPYALDDAEACVASRLRDAEGAA